MSYMTPLDPVLPFVNKFCYLTNTGQLNILVCDSQNSSIILFLHMFLNEMILACIIPQLWINSFDFTAFLYSVNTFFICYFSCFYSQVKTFLLIEIVGFKLYNARHFIKMNERIGKNHNFLKTSRELLKMLLFNFAALVVKRCET